MVKVNQLHDHNKPLSDHNSATHSHMDINCNIVYEVNDTQDMDISHDSAITRSQVGLHQQNFSVSNDIRGGSRGRVRLSIHI